MSKDAFAAVASTVFVTSVTKCSGMKLESANGSCEVPLKFVVQPSKASIRLTQSMVLSSSTVFKQESARF